MSDWLARNLVPQSSVIQLVSGLAYFVLGMVSARRTWRGSRLPLAGSLKWLAGFGFAMAVFEWSAHVADMRGGQAAEALLTVVSAASLAGAYASLHQFGAQSLRRTSRQHGRLSGQIGAVLLILWIVWVMGPEWYGAPDLETWRRSSNALAGLVIGLPASLLAAFGLRQNARSLVAPLAVPEVWRSLRRAGVLLLIFAVVACAILPDPDLMPALWPTVEGFEVATGVPMPLVRALLGAALAWSMADAMEVFQTEIDRSVRELEASQLLLAERERLGRELHDGTLQSIYAAGLILRAAESKLPSGDESAVRVADALRLLNDSVDEIRGYIGALQPPVPAGSLARSLRELAAARLLHSIAEVDLSIELPDGFSLEATRSGHVLAIVNEALSNVARHSGAQCVALVACLRDGQLCIDLTDDGVGIETPRPGGRGLRNIYERARILGGDCDLGKSESGGTRLRLRLPVAEDVLR